MRGSSMLLLVAGVIAGGCSRDAPTAAPEAMPEAVPEAVGAMPVALAVSSADLTADAIDDALGRLLPSLGSDGAVLKSPLLKLKANRSDQAARNELRRLLDLLATTLPVAYHADLDAVRLELGVSTK